VSIAQWTVFIDGRIRGIFKIDVRPLSRKSIPQYFHYKMNLDQFCGPSIKPKSNDFIRCAKLHLDYIAPRESLTECKEFISESPYYSLAQYEKSEPEYCKDQYTFVLIEAGLHYEQLDDQCKKRQGSIITMEDYQQYRPQIELIKSKASDSITELSWLRRKNDIELTSWCSILLTNDTEFISPCIRRVSRGICKIPASLQVRMIGTSKDSIIQQFDLLMRDGHWNPDIIIQVAKQK